MMPRQLRPVGEAVPVERLAALWRSDRPPAIGPDLQVLWSDDETYETQWYGSATSALAAALQCAVARAHVRYPEVIMPAYACPDIVAAAHFAGAHPVLADFLPDSTQLDPANVAAAMSDKTVAIVSVRLLGLPGNTHDLRAVTPAGRVLLIEDCAHVMPDSATVGSHADAVVVSFGRGKPVSLRRGGVLLTHRTRAPSWFRAVAPGSTAHPLRARLGQLLLCSLYNAAIRPGNYWALTRLARLPTDAIRLRPLRRIESGSVDLPALLPQALSIAQQAGDAQRWLEQRLSVTPGPWIDLHARMSAAGNALRLWRYPLLLSDEAQRDRLFERLWRAGLGASRMYRGTLADRADTAALVSTRKHSSARSLSQRLLTLPVHSDVRAQDLERIGEILDAFAQRPDAQPVAALIAPSVA